MKKMFFLISLALLLVLVAGGNRAFAFGGCEEDCSKCHFLNKDEARDILQQLKVSDAKVIDVKMSPIKGLWQIDVDKGGSKGVLYVGFSKKFVVGGPILELATSKNKTRESVGQLNRQPDRYVDVSKIPLDDAILLGSKNAKHKVIVFTDPECPYCARLHEQLKKVVEERKDVAFYLKLMPLKIHPDAYWKSESILCGNSLELLDKNFAKEPIPKPGPGCDTDPVDENIATAKQLGITGTPTMIMPDGLVVVGTRDAATIIDLASQPKGQKTAK